MICDDVQIIQGSLGSGKSMVAMVQAVEQLQAGGVLACNFTLQPGWAMQLASMSLRVKLGWKDHRELAQSYYDRAFKIGNPSSMIELSGDRGCELEKKCVGRRKGKREGKGLLIIDDCHHFFNSRTFSANKDYVAFFANARKYGWRTLLISHSVENIDKQIRSYIEVEQRFRNLQKVNWPWLPIPISPFFPLFMVIRKYYGLGAGSGMIHSRDVYMFQKKIAGLYDTLERFSSEDVLENCCHQGIDPGYEQKQNKKQEKKPITLGLASTWPVYRQVCNSEYVRHC